MASDRDHITPLALSTDRPTSDEEDTSTNRPRHLLRRRRCVICCGACTAVLVVIGLLILILALTVYKVRDPKLTMNSVTFQNVDLNAGGSSSPLSFNMTVVADVSVKNPNAVSFKFGGSTTSLYYKNQLVGMAYGPPGNARAQKTYRTNVTVDVMGDRLVGSADLIGDLFSGAITMESSTAVNGRVKILGIFKHHVDVVMNCSMTVSVATQAINNPNCRQRVWF